MPFISPMEELIQEEAILKTQRENILDLLQVRFGEVPQSLVEAVNHLEDISTLKQLFLQAISVGSLAEFGQLLDSSTDRQGQEVAIASDVL